MGIEDLTQFTQPAPPELAEDLADLPAAPSRLAVSGKTRNLARLADWPDLEALWVFEASGAQLGEVAARCRPRYLNLFGFKSPDLAWLDPLAASGRLEALELSNQFPTAEYARLSIALPGAACEMFQPFTEANIGREGRTVRVTGKRKPFLTLPEDQERLDRYVARFRALQDKFRAEMDRKDSA